MRYYLFVTTSAPSSHFDCSPPYNYQAMECSLFEPREEDVPHQARWEFSDHVANALLDCKVLRLVSSHACLLPINENCSNKFMFEARGIGIKGLRSTAFQ